MCGIPARILFAKLNFNLATLNNLTDGKVSWLHGPMLPNYTVMLVAKFVQVLERVHLLATSLHLSAFVMIAL